MIHEGQTSKKPAIQGLEEGRCTVDGGGLRRLSGEEQILLSQKIEGVPALSLQDSHLWEFPSQNLKQGNLLDSFGII